MKSWVIFILLLGYLHNVDADFSLTVMLNEFNAGQGFLASGDHCSDFWFQGTQCNIQLSISIDLSADDTNEELFCNNNMTTKINLGNVTSNANRIVFGQQTYGSWQNPQIFNNPGVYTGFRLCAEAKEMTTGELIDSFYANFINSQRVSDFDYYSHQRRNGTIDPTLILYAWTVKGDMDFPQPTEAPTTTTTVAPSTKPVDCEEAYNKGDLATGSQTITIALAGNKEVQVYCEVQGKFVQTVIQSRGEDDEPTPTFDDREYVDFQGIIGAPGPKSHFWLGLDNMNLLTTGRNIQYNMSIIACCDNTVLTRQFYSAFTIGNSSTGYILKATADSANAGYGLDKSPKDLNKKFSTNETYQGGPPRTICSASSPSINPNGNIGGWWFGACSNNLNGHYYKKSDTQFWDNPDTCTLKESAVVSADGFGSGIEINSKDHDQAPDVFINWISATRVRMAVYRADGQGVPPNTNFCS